MMRNPRLRLGLTGALLLAVGAGAGTVRAEKLHGIVYYVDKVDPARQALIAERYHLGLIEGHYGPDAVAIKSLNPDFKWFEYNSCTDNYVPGTEHDGLVAIASVNGWDIDDAYLHFFEDTEIVLEGDTLHIPGWGGGGAVSREEARVPVFYGSNTRKVLNFTGRGRYLNKLGIIDRAFGEPFPGTSLYPDGVFLDNAAFKLWSTGTVLEGGRVAEAPGNPVYGSNEFQEWHWFENLSPFLAALKDTLEGSAAWSADGARKEMMINVTNIWNDSYVTSDLADILCMEFQYSPVRNWGPSFVMNAYQREVMAAAAGIGTLQLAKIQTTVSGETGAFDYDEGLLGNAAFWLVTRTSTTVFSPMGTFNPMKAEWDTLNWRGVLDVVNDDLGEAVGDAFVVTTGTDPVGAAYTVTGRHYDNGLAVVRNRGRWDEGLGTETAVTVPLPGTYRRVDPDGNSGGNVTHIDLRNGEGAIFLSGDTGDTGGGPEGPPDPVGDLARPLRLVATNPRHGTVNVPAGAPVRIEFDGSLQQPVPADRMVVTGSESGARGGTLDTENDGRRLVFLPDSPWLPGEQVVVWISPSLARADGERLDANRDAVGGTPGLDAFSFQFTVAP
jgi:hypothetical protein